jgi:hypothetical protein
MDLSQNCSGSGMFSWGSMAVDRTKVSILESFQAMRQRQKERRPKQKPFGVMPLGKQIEQLPSYQRVTLRFGLTTDLNTAPEAFKCFQWLKTQPEVKAAMPTAPVAMKTGTTQDVRQVEAALVKLAEGMQQICALRVRWLMHSALN